MVKPDRRMPMMMMGRHRLVRQASLVTEPPHRLKHESGQPPYNIVVGRQASLNTELSNRLKHETGQPLYHIFTGRQGLFVSLLNV